MANLNTKVQGNNAENMACHYLQSKGLLLLQQNFNCQVGEIDLIMQDTEEIVFVEVRSRNKNIIETLESVDLYKQKKIIKAANYYLQKKKWHDNVNCRFDVIGINLQQIEWIKNAFYADNF